ncbi:hypothetical protein EYB33_19045 [Lysinibacillus sphaericus]|uniref:hypothetical protein n=1 Tax=Lysinibacillus sphaericus TaxID=1421 RepID=UPI001E3D0C62|nr:hypothetical protein [Lysinibacillus sphaericus]MCS1384862.1 hypothetical protein [Lysinibacillus sphaericus]UDK98237.1 hypothetical protein EYB33_19045 [Lysinibacillus sphaericus]
MRVEIRRSIEIIAGESTKYQATMCRKNRSNRLFAIDKKINKMDECTPELRYQKRLEQSKPVLDDFWCG